MSSVIVEVFFCVVVRVYLILAVKAVLEIVVVQCGGIETLDAIVIVRINQG